MRYAGIDYGKKRIGIALASENSSLAFAHSVLENNASKESNLLNFFSENKVTDVVLGESRDFKGNENTVMGEIKDFSAWLIKEGYKVHWEAEYLTSAAARSLQGLQGAKKARATSERQLGKPKEKNDDAVAAAIILQSFLDRIRKPEAGEIQNP